jgi:hypothetical protein
MKAIPGPTPARAAASPPTDSGRPASDSAATPLHDQCQSWNRAQRGRIAVADVQRHPASVAAVVLPRNAVKDHETARPEGAPFAHYDAEPFRRGQVLTGIRQHGGVGGVARCGMMAQPSVEQDSTGLAAGRVPTRREKKSWSSTQSTTDRAACASTRVIGEASAMFRSALRTPAGRAGGVLHDVGQGTGLDWLRPPRPAGAGRCGLPHRAADRFPARRHLPWHNLHHQLGARARLEHPVGSAPSGASTRAPAAPPQQVCRLYAHEFGDAGSALT